MSTDRPVVRSQKNAEGGQNHIDDVQPDSFKQIDDFSSLCGPIVDGYINNRLSIHLHACAVLGTDDSITCEFCIRYAQISTAELDILDTAEGRKCCIDAMLRAHGKQESAMLIDILELLKQPKPVRYCCIPSVIRLQALDNCLNHRGDISDSAKSAAIEPIGRFKDGKHGLSRLFIRQRSLVRNGEVIDQMIQRTPEIMEAVTDQLSNQTWRLVDSIKPNDIISSFRIDFVRDNVRVSQLPTGNLIYKRLQVLICPI
jgi:hypothetical protein